MDYKGFKINKVRIVVFFLVSIIFFSCTQKEKSDRSNTYFIEFVNFNDSLKQYIEKDIIGKVSYHKDKQLNILSANYVTTEYPDIHYFNNFDDIGKKVKPGLKKIRIELIGNYTVDSINYSLQKHIFKNKQWEKISDIGVLKLNTTYKKSKVFNIKEFVVPMVKNLVEYTY